MKAYQAWDSERPGEKRLQTFGGGMKPQYRLEIDLHKCFYSDADYMAFITRMEDTHMKDILELAPKMVALIENVEVASQGKDAPVFTPQAVEIIKEIAAYSKTTKAYQQQAQRVAEFWAEPHTPADVWTFMLHKIVNAPFVLYRNAAVLWHMPALEKAIEEAQR